MKKVLYMDVETTGFNPGENDIVQLAGLIEVDGKVVETFNLLARPVNEEAITDEALAITGKTKDEIMKYPPAKEVHKKFVEILEAHCDKFDRSDKYYVAGYNVQFDLSFLFSFFKKCGDAYCGSWFNGKKIDPMPLLHFLDYRGDLKLDNYKLETACRHFKIEVKAHDALEDIVATRSLLKSIEIIIANPSRKEKKDVRTTTTA